MGHVCFVLHVLQNLPSAPSRDPWPNGQWSTTKEGWGVYSSKMQEGKQGTLCAKTRKHQPLRGSTANCVGSKKVFRNLVPFSDTGVWPAKVQNRCHWPSRSLPTKWALKPLIRTGKLPGFRGQGEGTFLIKGGNAATPRHTQHKTPLKEWATH